MENGQSLYKKPSELFQKLFLIFLLHLQNLLWLHKIAHKKLKEITEEQILNAFGAGNNLSVYTDVNKLRAHLLKINTANSNLLMMSSGTFDGMDFTALAKEIYV